mmetsp:Transcript_25595/g.74044  ORF Transcript_25595/g.74044 Transcript_25595/m.74044 type:complete len:306 (+) Transcript_25595:1390-2307(+)
MWLVRCHLTSLLSRRLGICRRSWSSCRSCCCWNSRRPNLALDATAQRPTALMGQSMEISSPHLGPQQTLTTPTRRGHEGHYPNNIRVGIVHIQLDDLVHVLPEDTRQGRIGIKANGGSAQEVIGFCIQSSNGSRTVVLHAQDADETLVGLGIIIQTDRHSQQARSAPILRRGQLDDALRLTLDVPNQHIQLDPDALPEEGGEIDIVVVRVVFVNFVALLVDAAAEQHAAIAPDEEVEERYQTGAGRRTVGLDAKDAIAQSIDAIEFVLGIVVRGGFVPHGCLRSFLMLVPGNVHVRVGFKRLLFV